MTIIYREILSWSRLRPLWQRDALRRIIQKNALSAEDIGELAEFCKSDFGLIDKSSLSVEPIPLENRHIPEDVEGSKGSILKGISDIRGVNALLPDQKLEFLPDKGLTIIYGDNGSGKTGFVRILKRVCRTRGIEGPIKKDVFNPNTTEFPSATIHFFNESQEISLPWFEDSSVGTPPELSSVAIFDDSAASVYVGKENEVIWLPGGLDLFSKLADACQRVSSVLRTELKNLEVQRLILPEMHPETEVSRITSNLGNASKEEIIKLSRITEEDEQSIIKLNKEIVRIDSEDPVNIALKTRRKVAWLKQLVDRYENIKRQLSDDSIRNLILLKDDAEKKRSAALIASTTLFHSDPLPGIGTESWTLLWDSARRYSEEEAYKGKEFPVIEERTVCVLCQQKLQSDAKERLKRFSDFIKEDVQTKAQEAQKAIISRGIELKNLVIKTELDNTIMEEIRGINENLSRAVTRSLIDFDNRRNVVLEALEADSWTEIPAWVNTPQDELLSQIKDLETEAERYEKLNASIEKERLTRILHSLLDRIVLRDHKDKVIEEKMRLERLEKYSLAIQSTDTKGITRKNTDLTKKVVTDELCGRFRKELVRLGLDYLSVELEPVKGEVGVLKHHVVLKSGAERHSPQGIVSEGEFRCIALASFFAEATSSENVSSIVLDDPVSSLDHERRQRIAERLVEEGVQRQVIIFTHDLTFLLYLQGFLPQYSVKSEYRHICNVGKKPGFCKPDIPWDGMSIGKRIGCLKSEWKSIEKAYRNEDSESYKTRVRAFYDSIRETWECGVEEKLLNRVVIRFSREVNTRRLRQVVKNDLSCFYPRLEKGMAKCSQWTAHSRSAEINQPTPSPEEIKNDILELESWVDDLNNLYK